jgi:hypothetical protein
MVEQGYPAVRRPRAVEFGELRATPGGPVQVVDLVGPDGEPRRALYPMQRQPGGGWAINGCRLE